MSTKHHDDEQHKSLESRKPTSMADLSQVAGGSPKLKGILSASPPSSSGKLHPDCNFATAHGCDTGPAAQPIHT